MYLQYILVRWVKDKGTKKKKINKNVLFADLENIRGKTVTLQPDQQKK